MYVCVREREGGGERERERERERENLLRPYQFLEEKFGTYAARGIYAMYTD